MTADFRDLAIADAVAEAESLRADAATYREISRSALDQLASLTAAHRRLREAHRQLVDENRRLRETVLRELGVVA